MSLKTRGSARAIVLSSILALALVVGVPRNSSAAQDADGFCQSYLLLGELAQGNGANPTVANMQLDYLADGAGLTDGNIIPFEGQVVNPNFNGAAASTGFVAGTGTHPSGPTIIAPTVTGNNVDFSTVYSDQSDLMTYAWTYVDVPAGSNINAFLGLAPDDGTVAYCNGVYLGSTGGWHNNNDVWETLPITLIAGRKNLIMVKVFEGGGGHNLRLRIQQTADTGGAANSTPVPGITYTTDGTGYTYPVINSAAASRDIPGAGLYGAGETVEVVITATPTNGSPSAVVTETAPWNVVGTPSASQGSIATAGNVLTWDIGTLTAPQTLTYQVSAQSSGDVNFSGNIQTDINSIITGFDELYEERPISGILSYDWHGDIGNPPAGAAGGNPSVPGSATFGAGVWTISGAGGDIWGTVDRCHILTKRVTGDFVLEGSVEWQTESTNEWCKAGLSIRQKVQGPGAHSYIVIRSVAQHADSEVVFQWRDTYGASAAWTEAYGDAPAGPVRLRLVRTGTIVTGFWHDGTQWIEQGSHDTPGLDDDEVAASLVVTSHADPEIATALFSNINIAQIPLSGAVRTIDTNLFTPGTPIHVQIDLNRSAAGPVNLTETVPAGWTVSAITGGGSAAGNVITWTNFTGSQVEYDVTPVAGVFPGNFDGDYSGTVSGIDFSGPVSGQASVAPGDRATFQQGVWPDATYAGTRDAHIIMYAGVGDAAIHQNTGANAFIEEGDWYGVQNPFNDDPDGTGPLPPDAPRGFDDNKLIVIGFNMDDVPAGSEIEEAWYRMWYFNERRTGGTTPSLLNDHTTYIHAIAKPWGEGAGNGVDGRDAINGEVSWAFARTGLLAWDVSGARGVGTDIVDPAIVSAQSAAPHGATFDVWVEYDVTDIVQYWVDNPGSNYGMKISQDDVGSTPTVPNVFGAYDYFSSENTEVNRRPTLTVKFVPGLDAQNWSLYE